MTGATDNGQRGRTRELRTGRWGLVERPGEYPFSSAAARFERQMEGRRWV
jgi:hypothetical protein